MNGYRAERRRALQGERISYRVRTPPRGECIPHGERSLQGDRDGALDTALRCVSSGYLGDGCSCRACVPVAVASDAWREELERVGVCEGFFHFAWRGETWLAYGLAGGRVRGVYCPAHRCEREQRLGYDPELVVEI
jgi:hypothetical protein